MFFLKVVAHFLGIQKVLAYYDVRNVFDVGEHIKYNFLIGVTLVDEDIPLSLGFIVVYCGLLRYVASQDSVKISENPEDLLAFGSGFLRSQNVDSLNYLLILLIVF